MGQAERIRLLEPSSHQIAVAVEVLLLSHF